MKACGGVDVYIQISLTPIITGGEWSASHPGRFAPGERALNTHWIGSWVDPRAGLDDVQKRTFLTLPGLQLRLLLRPARTQSLHRLRYHGSHLVVSGEHNITRDLKGKVRGCRLDSSDFG
jgi:hypothetical protein